MNARRLILKELKESGYIFKRSCGNHDIYYHPELRKIIPIKRSFTEKDLVYIRNEIKNNRR